MSVCVCVCVCVCVRVCACACVCARVQRGVKSPISDVKQNHCQGRKKTSD